MLKHQDYIFRNLNEVNDIRENTSKYKYIGKNRENEWVRFFGIDFV